MRRRIGGSLFSLALILFLVGISYDKDFWTKAPEDLSPIQQSQDEASDSAEIYTHDNPRVTPIELEKKKRESQNQQTNEEAQPSFIHENGLSILMIEDIKKPTANLHFVTYQPEEHAVYVSRMKNYNAQSDTEEMVQKLESDLNYPLDYYIRVDKGALKSITEDVLDNSYVQQTLDEQEPNVLGEHQESLNLGSVVKNMSQLSFGALMSLNKLVTSLSEEVETNLSVAEILTLREKYELEAFLEPLKVKRGLVFNGSVPVMNDNKRDETKSVSEMLGGL